MMLFHLQRKIKFCMSWGASCYHAKGHEPFRITLLASEQQELQSSLYRLYHFHPFQSSLFKIPKTSLFVSWSPNSNNSRNRQCLWMSFLFVSTCLGSRSVCSRLATVASPQAAQEARLVTKIRLKWEGRAVLSRPVSPGTFTGTVVTVKNIWFWGQQSSILKVP